MSQKERRGDFRGERRSWGKDGGLTTALGEERLWGELPARSLEEEGAVLEWLSVLARARGEAFRGDLWGVRFGTFFYRNACRGRGESVSVQPIEPRACTGNVLRPTGPLATVCSTLKDALVGSICPAGRCQEILTFSGGGTSTVRACSKSELSVMKKRCRR